MTDNISVKPNTSTGAVSVRTKEEADGKHTPIYATGRVSTANSSTTLLTNGSTFTGDWEDVAHYNNVVVAVKTDQNGYFTIQFSPDGVNQDSTLTRYYRTTNIEAPHKFTVTRQYCRVTFTNDSGSDQTYLRLQTLYGEKSDLNIPQDSTMAPDYDAIATRPTDYRTEVALGRRQGADLWNKWGYNLDVDIGTELVASWGGSFTINTTARTLSIVSDSANDDDGGTGCNSIVIYGIDENWNEATEVVTLNGLTPVVTTSTWIGLNRVAMYLCGSGRVNAGTITATKTTDLDTIGQIPAGEGVSQQCIFYVPVSHKFNAEWMLLNAARQAGGNNPIVTFKMWVYSALNNGKQDVFRYTINTAVNVEKELTPKLPFPIGEKSIIWIEATTDLNNTEVGARFSGMLIADVDH